MSKKPSSEEALRQKMSEVPLPDENASWQTMNALLDEKEKRRGFFFFRNEKIAGAALLLCILLAGLALFLQTEKQPTDRLVQKDIVDGKANKMDSNGMISKKDYEERVEKGTTRQGQSNIVTPLSTPDSLLKDNNFLPQKKSAIVSKSRSILTTKKASGTRAKSIRTGREKASRNDASAQLKHDNGIEILSAAKEEKQTSATGDSSFSIETDNGNTTSSTGTNSSETIVISKGGKLQTDSTSSNNTAPAAMVRVKRRGSYFIDVGIGVKQQIAIDSQIVAANHYNGRKSWLGDYIPSLYVKLEKEKRWFIQGEFHYASPRLINAVSYWQKTKADYGHSNIQADRYFLQKTWYHEIPLSFNVYIRPSWSVGAGIMYNRLRGAVAGKETSVYDALSGQYTNTSILISRKGFTDSFLYKTNTSLLLQTDYGIRRWSFGLRYIHDVQPYLTYTLPDGERKDKRNTSLEVLIRYRFYRSGRFRIGKL